MGIDMLYLIGAGGHCKVVIDALRSSGASLVGVKVRDGNRARQGAVLHGLEIETPDVVPDLCGAQFHLAIGACDVRAKRHAEIVALGGAPHTIIHASAIRATGAQIGEGSFIAAGAIIGPDAKIGASVIVNHGAVIDHDCVVGDFCHIAPNATLGGAVRVGNGVLIGSGAVVLPTLSIGNGAVIGAGAVVTRSVAANQIWVGNPACEQVKL